MYEDFEDNNPKWMKLVDLYNERWKEKFGDDEWCFTYEMRFDTVHLISKPMGFVKRLVDNDKVNVPELDLAPWKENTIIMMLSISSSPLNDLFTLLK